MWDTREEVQFCHAFMHGFDAKSRLYNTQLVESKRFRSSGFSKGMHAPAEQLDDS